jgi:hypothetical protein
VWFSHLRRRSHETLATTTSPEQPDSGQVRPPTEDCLLGPLPTLPTAGGSAGRAGVHRLPTGYTGPSGALCLRRRHQNRPLGRVPPCELASCGAILSWWPDLSSQRAGGCCRGLMWSTHLGTQRGDLGGIGLILGQFDCSLGVFPHVSWLHVGRSSVGGLTCPVKGRVVVAGVSCGRPIWAPKGEI